MHWLQYFQTTRYIIDFEYDAVTYYHDAQLRKTVHIKTRLMPAKWPGHGMSFPCPHLLKKRLPLIMLKQFILALTEMSSQVKGLGQGTSLSKPNTTTRCISSWHSKRSSKSNFIPDTRVRTRIDRCGDHFISNAQYSTVRYFCLPLPYVGHAMLTSLGRRGSSST